MAIRYLKNVLLTTEYKPIKKQLKELLVTFRKPGVDAERKLTELHRILDQAEMAKNDCDRLYSLLYHLSERYGIESEVVQEDTVKKPGVIYLLKDHIDTCFNDAGQQVAPLSLCIESPGYRELPNIIALSGRFMAVLQEENKALEQAHFQLHPIPGKETTD